MLHKLHEHHTIRKEDQHALFCKHFLYSFFHLKDSFLVNFHIKRLSDSQLRSLAKIRYEVLYGCQCMIGPLQDTANNLSDWYPLNYLKFI